MSAPENPLAFPVYAPSDGEYNGECREIGMTLRDYFAIRCLAIIYADRAPEWTKTGHLQIGDLQGAAHQAYRMADAMLCERSEA